MIARKKGGRENEEGGKNNGEGIEEGEDFEFGERGEKADATDLGQNGEGEKWENSWGRNAVLLVTGDSALKI